MIVGLDYIPNTSTPNGFRGVKDLTNLAGEKRFGGVRI